MTNAMLKGAVRLRIIFLRMPLEGNSLRHVDGGSGKEEGQPVRAALLVSRSSG
jgi:hypothetical protein